MEDLYYEQIVEKEGEKKAGAVKMLIIVAAMFLLFTGLMRMNSVLMFAGVIVGLAGFYFVVPLMYVEFEYLYMSKELTVDRIFNKEKRRKAGNWSLESMEIIAPLGHEDLAYYLKQDGNKKNIHDFTSGVNPGAVFVIVLKDKDNTQIYFEPNDEILRAIRQQFPRQARYNIV